jgi:hypothetical protein
MARQERSLGVVLTRAANAILETATAQLQHLSDEELETIEEELPAAYLFIREEPLSYEDWASGDHSRAFTYAWVIAVLTASELRQLRQMERRRALEEKQISF